MDNSAEGILDRNGSAASEHRDVEKTLKSVMNEGKNNRDENTSISGAVNSDLDNSILSSEGSFIDTDLQSHFRTSRNLGASLSALYDLEGWEPLYSKVVSLVDDDGEEGDIPVIFYRWDWTSEFSEPTYDVIGSDIFHVSFDDDDETCYIVAKQSDSPSFEQQSDWMQNFDVVGILGMEIEGASSYKGFRGFVYAFNTAANAIESLVRTKCDGANRFQYAGYSRGGGLVQIAAMQHYSKGIITASDNVSMVLFNSPNALESSAAAALKGVLDEAVSVVRFATTNRVLLDPASALPPFYVKPTDDVFIQCSDAGNEIELHSCAGYELMDGEDCNISICGDSNKYCDSSVKMCLDKFDDGNPCLNGDSCESGICHLGFCRSCDVTDPTGSCDSGKFCNAGSFNCVDKYNDGSACLTGHNCKSGICHLGFCRSCDVADPTGSCNSGKFCNAGSFNCVDKYNDGKACLTGHNCKSGICHLGFCRSCDVNNPVRSCGSGKFCNAGSFTCVNQYNNGIVCASGANCKSGSCGIHSWHCWKCCK
uniref:Uncharacterized protein n=1 Tax=Ditylum brightwellii TaxID=49249 RepID=A0A7S4V5R6_9STRA